MAVKKIGIESSLDLFHLDPPDPSILSFQPKIEQRKKLDAFEMRKSCDDNMFWTICLEIRGDGVDDRTVERGADVGRDDSVVGIVVVIDEVEPHRRIKEEEEEA